MIKSLSDSRSFISSGRISTKISNNRIIFSEHGSIIFYYGKYIFHKEGKINHGEKRIDNISRHERKFIRLSKGNLWLDKYLYNI